MNFESTILFFVLSLISEIIGTIGGLFPTPKAVLGMTAVFHVFSIPKQGIAVL